jgi:hypothetical protein
MTSPHDAVVSLPTEQADRPGALTAILSEDMPEDRPGLEARIRKLETAIASCNEHIRSLMDREDPAKGVFHAAAIHESKQRHMQLRYLKDVCVARLSRLRAY